MKTWVKLYTEILRDPKMGRLTDRQFRVCINLFALAGLIDEDGNLVPLADIAWHLRCDEAELTEDMQALAATDIVEETGGIWRVKHFEERQRRAPSTEPEAVRERVTRHREKERNEEKATIPQGCNEDVTSVKRDVTSPDTDTDTDTDTDIEKRRKEIVAAQKTAPRFSAAQSRAMFAVLASVCHVKEVSTARGRLNRATNQCLTMSLAPLDIQAFARWYESSDWHKNNAPLTVDILVDKIGGWIDLGHPPARARPHGNGAGPPERTSEAVIAEAEKYGFEH